MSCHFTHIKIKRTLLNMYLCCDQGDRFISKTRLSAMKKTQGSKVLDVRTNNIKLNMTVRLAAFRLEAVNHCFLAYQAQTKFSLKKDIYEHPFINKISLHSKRKLELIQIHGTC